MKITHTYSNETNTIDEARLDLVYRKYIEKFNELTLIDEKDTIKDEQLHEELA